MHIHTGDFVSKSFLLEASEGGDKFEFRGKELSAACRGYNLELSVTKGKGKPVSLLPAFSHSSAEIPVPGARTLMGQSMSVEMDSAAPDAAKSTFV